MEGASNSGTKLRSYLSPLSDSIRTIGTVPMAPNSVILPGFIIKLEMIRDQMKQFENVGMWGKNEYSS